MAACERRSLCGFKGNYLLAQMVVRIGVDGWNGVQTLMDSGTQPIVYIVLAHHTLALA